MAALSCIESLPPPPVRQSTDETLNSSHRFFLKSLNLVEKDAIMQVFLCENVSSVSYFKIYRSQDVFL